MSNSRNRTMRKQMQKHFGAGKERDYDGVLGYPEQVEPEHMKQEFIRGGLARRIVEAYPSACWRVDPILKGTDEFVTAFNNLDSHIDVFSALSKLDRVTGLGRWGILVVGLDDGRTLDLPVDTDKPNLKVQYLRSYGEADAKVVEWNDDPTSSQFGSPKVYQVTRNFQDGRGQGTFKVHHSRVIHVAENSMSDPYVGEARLETVWNRLIDMTKLLGGGAEIYWLNAGAFYHLDAEAGSEWEPEAKEDLREQLDDVQDGLSRFIRTKGVSLDQVAPTTNGDSGTQVDRQLDQIAGALGIPKRILVGSEAGELASSQDESNWAARVDERREQHLIPNIVIPFLRLLARYGIIPGGLNNAYWPESEGLGDSAKATIALSKAQALQTYGNTLNVDEVVSVGEFRKWLGLTGTAPATDLEEEELSETGDDRDYFDELKERH